MKKSKYLVLNSFYFDFNDDLTEITNVKELFKKQNILDLHRFDKMKIIIKKNFFANENINFIYLPVSIEKIGEYAFLDCRIQILDLSNCINLKNIGEFAFEKNQIKQLKLPENIEIINSFSFYENQIEILDLSKYLNLKNIEMNAFSNNPFKKIKILDNINIKYNGKNINEDDLWNKFILYYYYKNNRKAGDYKYKNGNWQWYPL